MNSGICAEPVERAGWRTSSSLRRLVLWVQVGAELVARDLALGRALDRKAPFGRDLSAALQDLMHGGLLAINRVGKRLFGATENLLCPQEGIHA